ncbi:hypothetical protein Tco_0117703 [Tanacetum coccineum]
MDTIPHRLADVMAFLIPISKGSVSVSWWCRGYCLRSTKKNRREKLAIYMKNLSTVATEIPAVPYTKVPTSELERYLQTVSKSLDDDLITVVMAAYRFIQVASHLTPDLLHADRTNMYPVSKKGKSIMSSSESVYGSFGGDVGSDLDMSSLESDIGKGQIVLDFENSALRLPSAEKGFRNLAASNN